MAEFDGSNFDRTIELHTNTELDEIGHSYNELLGNIQRLLEEIKEQERELRTSELNMLISQINPHFLYNTLDTIYTVSYTHLDVYKRQGTSGFPEVCHYIFGHGE